MKKYYILLVLFTCFIYSCKEDERGQYAIDSIPPGEIKSAVVENVLGGAIISYVIPDDDDLLYVKATYTLDDGTVMEQKASAYASSLKIEGIGKSREVTVTLISGDRSKNESKPVVVITHPLDAPIYSILESIESFDDFGGIRLSWANPNKADVVLGVITLDELGKFVVVQNFYTNSPTGKGNVRGFPAEDRIFGLFLRDRWGNMTDTIKRNYLPLFEEEVKGTYVRWNPTGIPYNYNVAYPTQYHIEKMWDNNIATFYLQKAAAYPHSFTFDMGKTVKLSRLHTWQRQDASVIYTSQNINKFELWGSATPNVNASYAGWTFLGDYIATKPSGEPLGTNTAEDKAFAVTGEDFTVDPNAPPVRYIRYDIKGTWSGDTNVSIGELKCYGSIQ